MSELSSSTASANSGTTTMHPLLKRQLKKMGIALDTLESGELTAEAWRNLVERVSATYAQADQDRYMLERSLERSSEEMARLYDELRDTSAAEIARKSDQIAQSLALMNGVQESVADAIVVVDNSSEVVCANQRFFETWKVTRNEMHNMHREDFVAHVCGFLSRPDEFLARIQKIQATPEVVTTDELELLDGRILIRYTAPVRTPDGVVRARVWCFRDVTEERKLAARRAVVAERMASVGQLVASVAHEINNPLAYIAGNVELVADALREQCNAIVDEQSEQDEMNELIAALDDARLGVDRIKVIVRDLRALSRVDEETREPTDVRAVLDTALQMANNELRHRARVVREMQPTPLVSANAVRLTQVFINLLVNAAHAIPDGRASENTITIKTETSSTSGGACICISDTGGGIAPEHLERIYDPFFTTKTLGAGTGLGLSICKGIIDKLGGTIDVRSTVGYGTTFTVELPPHVIAAAAATHQRGHSPVPRSGRASKHQSPHERRSILVVDDDAQIRRWFKRILPGHDVTAVPSVDAAEEALLTQSFDAILCDVMMPDRTGLDMHTSFKTKRPELLPRVIFMSGGAFTPTLATFLEEVPNTCLKKPFSKQELERAIERAVTLALPVRRVG